MRSNAVDGAKNRVYQTRQGHWRLTTAERKRILLDHIYGVDIDAQAVEVTKLSLLLKILEGETKETLQRQLFAKQRALPDLAANIKCGNSLIGPDFYRSQQLGLFDDDERLRINVFNWEAEFPKIMQFGGFDAVIGNPPYVRMEMFAAMKEYLRERYESHDERADLYSYFVERALKLLNAKGFFGMIISNTFIRAKYGRPLRRVVCKLANVNGRGRELFSGKDPTNMNSGLGENDSPSAKKNRGRVLRPNRISADLR